MMGREQSRERGMTESVQWAVLGTALMLCLLGLVEAGLMLHGRSVAVSAALAGAKAQAALYAAPGAGKLAAASTAAAGGLIDVQVTVTVTSSSVTVQVDGQTPSLTGWMQQRTHAESTRPLEGQ